MLTSRVEAIPSLLRTSNTLARVQYLTSATRKIDELSSSTGNKMNRTFKLGYLIKNPENANAAETGRFGEHLAVTLHLHAMAKPNAAILPSALLSLVIMRE